MKKEKNLIQVDEKKLKEDLAAGNSLEKYRISGATKAGVCMLLYISFGLGRVYASVRLCLCACAYVTVCVV